jgi:hypothetical protein
MGQRKMKKVFMDANLTGFHRDTTIISIALTADTNETFYAELNDYDKAQIDKWTKENVIHNLLYAPPPKGQDEYWAWNKDNKVRMRGNKREVNRYLGDWFQALLGGPLSWVDYEKGEKPKEIKERSIEIWGYCFCYDWVLFNDLWGSSGMTAPKCLHYIPYDLAMFKSNIQNKGYLDLYEKGKKQNAFSATKAIQVCYKKLEKERLKR